jgi:DNA-binding transcriptional LysR family regulator
MDIKGLKLFCDVIRLKGFSQAAAENSITQSAVSQRIKSLEKQFGVSLIDGRASDLHPTKAGEALFKGAKRILSDYQEMEERLQEISGKASGTVHVEAIYSVGLYELDPFFKKFLKDHIDIEVQIEYAKASKIYQDILAGTIDLGIVAYPPRKPELGTIPLAEDELVLICRPERSLGREGRFSLRHLESQPFLTFHQGHPTRKAIDNIFTKHGVSVEIKAKFDNIELIKRAVEIGLGYSLVPSTTVKSEIKAGLLKALSPMEGPFRRPIAILYRRGRTLSQAVKKFIAVLTGKQS